MVQSLQRGTMRSEGTPVHRSDEFKGPMGSSGFIAIDTVPWGDLAPQHRTQWEQMREGSTRYRSPFFSTRFVDVVHSIKGNINVTLFSRGSQIIGFLPFEHAGKNREAPVGGAFNDAHGVICDARSDIDYRDLVGRGAIGSYAFHALEGEASGFEPFVFGYVDSYLADLSRHREGYVAFLEANRGTIFKQRRKTKKMVKDLGPLRLEFDCRSPSVVQRLIELKRSQYQRTHIFDILSVDWARRMLFEFWERNDSRCRGIVSALYAGDTMVAVHYGILEGDWLHYWFPTYATEYHQYSPGTALFLEIARNSTALGISKIDMGYGEQAYKTKLTDTVTSMPYGLLDRSRLRWHCHKYQNLAIQTLKKVPFKESAKRVVRTVWPSFGRSKYQ